MITVIYKIENILNNDCYIGSSNNYSRRKKRHFESLRQRVHHSIKLQRAYDKYGILSFRIYELETFGFISKDKTLEREQYYIDTIKPKYNICLIAGSQQGSKRDDNFKRNQSNRMKGKPPWNKGIKTGMQSEETKIKRANSNRGKKRSDGVKIKLSKSRIGMVFSESHKKSLSESKLKGTANNKPIKSIDESGFEIEYIGVGEAERISGVSKTTIYKSLNNKIGKWKWKKKTVLKWMYI